MQYDINATEWTVIDTGNGVSSCYLDEQDDGAAGTVDVRIMHSATTPTDDDLTTSKRVYKGAGLQLFTPENESYYARCATTGDTAKLTVDEGVGVSFPSALDRSRTGIVTTTYQNNSVAYGFQIQKRFEIASSGTLNLVFDFSAATNKSIYGLNVNASSSAGECHLDTYKCTSYTGGTEITPLNLDERDGESCLTTVKQGVTVTGESNTREYTIGTESTRQSSGGGQVSDNIPKRFLNTPLVFHFENQESESTTITLGYIWYEL